MPKFFDYTRNGLFYVPIFICLGHIIKAGTRKTTKLDLLYALLFFILMSVEGSILHYYNLQRHDSMYLFLLPLMYFLLSNVRLFKDSLVKIIGDFFDCYDLIINLFGGQCQII